MTSNLLTTFFLLILILVTTSPSITSLSTISSAIEILTESNYLSMGLTLQLINKDHLLDQWQELTIFSPSDKSFSTSGQPSLLNINFQLSPTRLPRETLKNFPIGAKIPSLKPNSSLTFTNSSRAGGNISINNVVIQDSPLFDDGYIVIYVTEDFFKEPKITKTSGSMINSSIPIPSGSFKNLPNRSKPFNRFNIFESASRLLISRGFVIMATFLALQVESSNDTTGITVFAPIDDAILNHTDKFSDYVTIFKGHVIRQLLCLKDMQEGLSVETVLRGYDMKFTWSGDVLLVNEVPLIYPDLYVDEWIAVHGVNQMVRPHGDKLGESIEVLGNGEKGDYVHGEYSTELGDYGIH